MPGGEITGGLDPLNKSTLSAEVKSTHVYPKNGVETPDKSDLLPESDRVQLTKELQSIQAALTQNLTGNTELNQYIQIMRQSEAEGLIENSKEAVPKGETVQPDKTNRGDNLSYYA